MLFKEKSKKDIHFQKRNQTHTHTNIKLTMIVAPISPPGTYLFLVNGKVCVVHPYVTITRGR